LPILINNYLKEAPDYYIEKYNFLCLGLLSAFKSRLLSKKHNL